MKKGSYKIYSAIIVFVVLAVLLGFCLLMFQSFETSADTNSTTYSSINTTIHILEMENSVVNNLMIVGIVLTIIAVLVGIFSIVSKLH